MLTDSDTGVNLTAVITRFSICTARVPAGTAPQLAKPTPLYARSRFR